MDNRPCEYIIYVLTVIDSISHALSGLKPFVLPQLSKIRIPFVESNIHPVIEFAFSPLLDDECFGNIPQFTPWLVTYYMPSNRYPWCSFLSAPYYDFLSPVESESLSWSIPFRFSSDVLKFWYLSPLYRSWIFISSWACCISHPHTWRSDHMSPWAYYPVTGNTSSRCFPRSVLVDIPSEVP